VCLACGSRFSPESAWNSATRRQLNTHRRERADSAAFTPCYDRCTECNTGDNGEPGLLPGTTTELTTVRVRGFTGRLEVYVDAGELRAEHSFWVFGLPFLVLHYRMHRKPPRSR
jgi:hypothetical protein